MNPAPRYQEIIAHYEDCLARHGDTHQGVDWPKWQDVDTRYRVMLEVIRPQEAPVALLDFGCGAAHLLDYLLKVELNRQILYTGLDISPAFINLCRQKHPGMAFLCQDILAPQAVVPACDYAVLNGVFTEKRSLTYSEMWDYFTRLLITLFPAVRQGMAFNVMSKQVDWERDDLFHVPLDDLAWFLARKLSRHFVIRNDYGLYEYTVYVYKQPSPGGSPRRVQEEA